MERHAALPDGEYLQRMRSVVTGLVEQHVAQPPAQHHAEHAEEQQIVDEGVGNPAPGVALGAVAAEEEEQSEGHQVHEAVPADGDGAEADRDRIELRMDEHGCVVSGQPVQVVTHPQAEQEESAAECDDRRRVFDEADDQRPSPRRPSPARTTSIPEYIDTAAPRACGAISVALVWTVLCSM